MYFFWTFFAFKIRFLKPAFCEKTITLNFQLNFKGIAVFDLFWIKIAPHFVFLNLENTYQAHKNLVFNLALNYVQNTEDAEEITQDVFLSVHQSMSSFKGQSDIKTWIYRITINKSLQFSILLKKVFDSHRPLHINFLCYFF